MSRCTAASILHRSPPAPADAPRPATMGLALLLLLLACCVAPASPQAAGFLSGSLPLSALITTPVEIAKGAPDASVTLSSRQALQARSCEQAGSKCTVASCNNHNSRPPCCLHARRWSSRALSSPWALTLAQRPTLAAGQVQNTGVKAVGSSPALQGSVHLAGPTLYVDGFCLPLLMLCALLPFPHTGALHADLQRAGPLPLGHHGHRQVGSCAAWSGREVGSRCMGGQ